MKAFARGIPETGAGLNQIELFILLQLFDFMTTLIGLRLGGSEMSPFIRWLMTFDVVLGLGSVKILGFFLGGYCLYTRRYRVIGWVNVVFSALVAWNLYNILGALTP